MSTLKFKVRATLNSFRHTLGGGREDLVLILQVTKSRPLHFSHAGLGGTRLPKKQFLLAPVANKQFSGQIAPAEINNPECSY